MNDDRKALRSLRVSVARLAQVVLGEMQDENYESLWEMADNDRGWHTLMWRCIDQIQTERKDSVQLTPEEVWRRTPEGMAYLRWIGEDEDEGKIRL